MSENRVYQIEEILKLLPHRYPFLLLDRLEVEIPGEKGMGLKNLTMTEEFFQGHFPGNPIVPGVILCEIMAQGSVMLFKDELLTHLALYAGLDCPLYGREQPRSYMGRRTSERQPQGKLEVFP